ncbi:MAG: Holliday junction ATP-dependent DNA helicase RuvA [Proteobacteria bacterium]|nr:Holliday junction ATP-dependent DNA helicase RuvA [Pseudomonadota bacterium]
MIAYLKGRVHGYTSDLLVLNVQGVGYGVHVREDLLLSMSSSTSSQEIELWIHTHMSQDSLKLFGFCYSEEKELFHHLLSMPAVGPKLAMAIMSHLSFDDLVTSIRASDSLTLTKVPGIGAKKGKTLLIELMAKQEKILALAESFRQNHALTGPETTILQTNPSEADDGTPLIASQIPHYSQITADVRSALVNLNYSTMEATQTVSQVTNNIMKQHSPVFTFDHVFKQAISKLQKSSILYSAQSDLFNNSESKKNSSHA